MPDKVYMGGPGGSCPRICTIRDVINEALKWGINALVRAAHAAYVCILDR